MPEGRTIKKGEGKVEVMKTHEPWSEIKLR
jgi:hypothetical protein